MLGQRLGVSVAFLAGSLLATPSARAVALYGTNDPSANTAAPTGALAGSGWQYQGVFGLSVSTAIAPSHFVTAKHFSIGASSDFVYQGQTYDVIGSPIDDPNSDLRIWQVSGTFPSFAPLYTGRDEVGKPLVVFGKGHQRSSTEVTVAGLPKGWEFTTDTPAQRWGTNEVTGIADARGNLGEFVAFGFDAGVGSNEAHLVGGDSGGGVFIEDGGVWKLAGVNYAIDDFRRAPDSGPPFSAALYDTTGLFRRGAEGTWVPSTGPSFSYATRVSSNLAFIAANAPGALVPEPSSLGLIGAGLLLAARRPRRHRA